MVHFALIFFIQCFTLLYCHNALINWSANAQVITSRDLKGPYRIELQPSILEPLIWPWRSDEENSNQEIVYQDGSLSSSWKDKSWSSKINWSESCPSSAVVNITSEEWDQIPHPECIAASVSKHGGFSIKAEKPFGKAAALDFWIFIPENNTLLQGGPSNITFYDICHSSKVTAESAAICPAVRLLAGPVGDDLSDLSPLTLFLHSSQKGSNIFSAPLLTLAPDLKIGDWSHVIVPLGDSGWGGDHKWNRLTLMPTNDNAGLQFYMGKISINKEIPNALMSQSRVNSTIEKESEGKDVTIISGNQAARLEEVAVQLDDISTKARSFKKQGAHSMSAASQPSYKGSQEKESQQLVRYLYANNEIPDGVSDWSWLSDTSHKGGYLCGTLESFGGISLKSSQSFAKASVIKFKIKPPQHKFFINEKGRVQPVISIRLDATKEKFKQKNRNVSISNVYTRPSWQAFVTTEPIPLQYATPSLVNMDDKDDEWINGVLPLAGFGNHAWDRISFIDATGKGTKLCIDNVTVEYTMAVSEDESLPSLGFELNSSNLLEKNFKGSNLQNSKLPKNIDSALILSELCTKTNDVSCELGKVNPKIPKSRIQSFKLDNPDAVKDHLLVESFARVDPDGPRLGGPSQLVNGTADMGSEKTKNSAVLSQNTTVLILLVVVGVTFLISISAIIAVIVTYKFHKDKNLLKFWDRTFSASSSTSSHDDHWEGPERIPLKEIDCNFDYGLAIGVGSTCAVFRGKWRGQDVAVKAIHWKSEGTKPPPGELAICREIEYLPAVHSPFVIKIKAFAHASDTTYLVLEYCKHGNLQKLMKKGNIKMDRLRALRVLKDICMGLMHLNEAGISHRDVKSSNILIQCSHCSHEEDTQCAKDPDSCLVAKLGDLGVSKSYGTLHQTNLETFCGTPRWMAPERLMLQNSMQSSSMSRCSSISAASGDVYSFGIVAWEIIHYQITNGYELPFDEYNQKGLGAFVDGVYDSVNDGTLFNTSVDSGIQGKQNTMVSDISSESSHTNSQSEALCPLRSGPAKSNVWNPMQESSLYQKIIMGARPSIPDDCPGALADLIRECWAGKPDKRPQFADIAKRLELLIELQ